MTIRPAEPADLARLTALLVAQQREHDIPTPEPAIAATIAAMLGDPDRGFILVATVEGAIGGVWGGERLGRVPAGNATGSPTGAPPSAIEGVAYVSFARPLEHAGEVAWLEELYVSPSRRSEGLGKRLVEAVIARAEARGCVSVDLEVEADHVRAANLYAREGFRAMKRTHWVRPLSKFDW